MRSKGHPPFVSSEVETPHAAHLDFARCERVRILRGASLIAAAVLLIAAKPSGKPYMGGPDNWGEANRQTMAAQVIDPAPVYDTAVPETHAEHAGQAVERYRTDRVKLPDRVKTTDAGVAETTRDGGGK